MKLYYLRTGYCSLAFSFALVHFTLPMASAQSSALTSFFDTPRSLARSGNEAYTNKRFKEAEEQYRSSLEKDKNLSEGNFNLGDALYKQGRYDDAASQFRAFAENGKTAKDVRAQSYHNLGNALLKAQKLNDCVDAYKNALRLNPTDEDTRHNLAYAKQLLAEQQKKEQQKQQQNNQNENEQKQQDQQQNQDKNQQNQQPNQPQPPQNNQSPQQGQSQPKLSKADAERILEALNNEERNVQKKLIKRKATGVVIEKDW